MLKRIMFVIFIMSLASLVFAGGIALSGVGTRAKTMGGAMRGLADDASAMYWNPAGLSFLDETYITAGIHYVDFNGEYETPLEDTYENDDLLNLIPSVLFTKHCPDKAWNWGIGVYVPFGLSAEWDMYDFPAEYYFDQDEDLDSLSTLNYCEMEENETHGALMVIDVHPTFSYKFSEKLSAGLGISLEYAEINITKVEVDADTYLTPTFFELDGSGMGFGANFGLMYKPMEKLSLGLSGRLSSEMKLSGDGFLDIYTPGHDFNENTSGIISFEPEIDATMTLPADIGFGAGYKINDNLIVSADLTYTMWEVFDKITIEFEESSNLPDNEIVLNWENTMRFGLGTEYLMNKLAFRAGYYYDESPLVDETMTVMFPDFSTKNAVNLGLGWNITEKLCADLGIEYIMMAEREVDDDTEENLTGTYNGNITDIMVDFTWKF